MTTRTTTWAARSAAAVILLAGGFWGGRSLTTSTAIPRPEAGTIKAVNADGTALAIMLRGHTTPTGYALPATVLWQDPYGTWNEGTHPACLRPLTHGQHVTLGIITALPAASAPGGSIIAWVKCQRRPIPAYPVVSPTTNP
jgi:hypothetical protein